MRPLVALRGSAVDGWSVEHARWQLRLSTGGWSSDAHDAFQSAAAAAHEPEAVIVSWPHRPWHRRAPGARTVADGRRGKTHEHVGDHEDARAWRKRNMASFAKDKKGGKGGDAPKTGAQVRPWLG